MRHNKVIKSSHKRLLQRACEIGLKWVYEHVNLPPEYLENILEAAIKCEVNVFIIEIKLHYSLSNDEIFPLPPFKQIMPKTCSEWNGEKGFSDVTTKLTEFCSICLPVASV